LLRRPPDIIAHAAEFFGAFGGTFTQPPPANTRLRPLVLSGPEGSGKHTLVAQLLRDYPRDFGFAVRHTTRPAGRDEVDGVEFHFTDRDSLLRDAGNGKFVEYSELPDGHLEGTSVAAVADVSRSGKICVLMVNVEAVLGLKKSSLNPRYVFIRPPGVAELDKRLRANRPAGDTDQALAKRIEVAKVQLKFVEQTDLWDKIVENDKLDKAYAELKEVVEDDIRTRHAYLQKIGQEGPRQGGSASSSAASLSAARRPVAFAGPSGVGKGTIIERLMKEFPNSFGFATSTTTRQPRAGEVPGKSYHFITVEQFKRDIADGKFVEHAEVHGNFYGTSYASIEAVSKEGGGGKTCILDKDVQGIMSLRATAVNPKTIFIRAPSFAVLEERLKGRGSESEETLKRRLDTAKKEMSYVDRADLWDHVVMNDDLESCYKEIERILATEIKGKN
jgi:guanylate kinase